MKNFEFLNFPFSPFKNEIGINMVPKASISRLDISTYISEEFTLFLNALGLEIFLLESFFKQAGYNHSGTIHVDGSGGNYIKCNWVFGGGKSKMCWYAPKLGIIKDVLKTKTNTPYKLFLDEEVTLIESVAIINPTLVQVGIPHNVINVTEDRTCICLLLRDKFTKTQLTMEQGQNYFKDYLKVGH